MHLKKLQTLLAGVIGLFLCGVLTLNTQASVVTTRPEPPPIRGAWTADFETLDIDFNQDGVVDLRLLSGAGGMTVYLNGTNRIVIKANLVSGSTTTNYSGVGGLPPGTVIGSALNPNLGNYNWWTGFTNHYDLTQPYGSHEATAMIVGYGNQPIGDWGSKEGMIAVEFRISGQVHFGYVHFDFRPERVWTDGSGGYIYGWAYEDVPGVPIVAERIRNGPPMRDFKIASFTPLAGQNGAGVLAWNTVIGETNRVQASADLVIWENLSTNIVADRDSMFFVTPTSALPQRFFRILREN